MSITETANDVYQDMYAKSIDDGILKKLQTYKHYIQSFTDGETYADIGCGNGSVGDMVGATLYDKYREDNTSKDIRYLDIEISALTRPYDVAILCHVIEHLNDPIAALKNVHKSGVKYVFIAVPDAEYPNGRHKPYDYTIEHHRQFTTKSLDSVLALCGFTPLITTQWHNEAELLCVAERTKI